MRAHPKGCLTSSVASWRAGPRLRALRESGGSALICCASPIKELPMFTYCPVVQLTILGSVGGKFDVHTKHKTLPSHSSCTRNPPSHHARSHDRSHQAACSSPIFVWLRPVMAVTGGSRLPQLSACRATKRHPLMTTLVSEFARALLDVGAVSCHLMIRQSTFPPAR